MLKDLHALLFKPSDPAILAVFRMFFGLLMMVHAATHFQQIPAMYAPDRFHFTFPLFDFVRPWPGSGMQIHFIVMGLAAAGIMLGLFYRASAFVFFLAYTYAFLIDQVNYQNHYYLFSIMAFLFLITDAHHAFSVDSWRKKLPRVVPFWNIFLLRAQIVIVYFFGGIAKLNWDWLYYGEPMRFFLHIRAVTPPDDLLRGLLAPFVTPHFQDAWLIYFLSYGGLLFDLSIGFLLLMRPTRWLAFGLALFFNLTNKFLFGIGIFPWFMLASCVLFLDVKPAGAGSVHVRRNETPVFIFLAAYLTIQILMPLRHYAIPGNVLWTEEGQLYSWHMMTRRKLGIETKFWMSDPASGRLEPVDIAEDLSREQAVKMAGNPRLILKYAHHLRGKYQSRGVKDPVITAEITTSLNGRPNQYLVNPFTDLGRERYPFMAPAPWIKPLTKSTPIHPADDARLPQPRPQ